MGPLLRLRSETALLFPRRARSRICGHGPLPVLQTKQALQTIWAFPLFFLFFPGDGLGRDLAVFFLSFPLFPVQGRTFSSGFWEDLFSFPPFSGLLQFVGSLFSLTSLREPASYYGRGLHVDPFFFPEEKQRSIPSLMRLRCPFFLSRKFQLFSPLSPSFEQGLRHHPFFPFLS